MQYLIKKHDKIQTCQLTQIFGWKTKRLLSSLFEKQNENLEFSVLGNKSLSSPPFERVQPLDFASLRIKPQDSVYSRSVYSLEQDKIQS